MKGCRGDMNSCAKTLATQHYIVFPDWDGLPEVIDVYGASIEEVVAENKALDTDGKIDTSLVRAALPEELPWNDPKNVVVAYLVGADVRFMAYYDMTAEKAFEDVRSLYKKELLAIEVASVKQAEKLFRSMALEHAIRNDEEFQEGWDSYKEG